MSFKPITLPSKPKILIIKPSAWGDIVHSLPFLSVVRKRYPDAEIHWVVAKGLHTFLTDHPLINKLWIMDKEAWKDLSQFRKMFREIRAFRKGLRKEKFDISIDLSGLLRSGLITRAAKAKYRLGFADAAEGSPFFYTHKVEGGDRIHAIDRYLKLAHLMDCDTTSIEYPFAPLPDISKLLSTLPERFCIISPSAGKDANRWPAERYGELAAKLPVPSVVVAGPADAAIADNVTSLSNGKSINLAGKTSLMELVALIAQSEFFICNDTGPMHIAAALNIPVFAIFGPANPTRTGPYGDGHTIIRVELACSPCYAKKPCTKHNWSCMNDLAVSTVLHSILQQQPSDSKKKNAT